MELALGVHKTDALQIILGVDAERECVEGSLRARGWHVYAHVSSQFALIATPSKVQFKSLIWQNHKLAHAVAKDIGIQPEFPTDKLSETETERKVSVQMNKEKMRLSVPYFGRDSGRVKEGLG